MKIYIKKEDKIQLNETALKKLEEEQYVQQKEVFLLIIRDILQSNNLKILKIINHGLLMPPLYQPEKLQNLQNLSFFSLAIPYLTSHTPKLLYQKKSFVHLTPIDIFVVFLEYILFNKKQSCQLSTLFPLSGRKVYNMEEFIKFLENYTEKYQYTNAIQRTSPTEFKDEFYGQNESKKCQIFNQDQMMNYFLETIKYYNKYMDKQIQEELLQKSKGIFYEIYFQNDLGFIDNLDKEFINRLQYFEQNFDFKSWLDIVLTYTKKFILNEQIDNANEYLQYIDINVKKDHRDIFFENLKQNKSYVDFQQIIDTSHMMNYKNSKKVKESIEQYLKKALENVQPPHEKVIKEILTQINKELKKDEKVMYGKKNRFYIRFFSYLVGKFMQRCYERILVDKNFIEFIKNYDKKINGPVIFIPTHQSYFDFLVVSYVCLTHYYQVPFIAAGSNLNKILGVGTILKNSSAFFIKRTGLRYPEIYRAFLQVYIDTLLQANFDIEFFIEGTRSRTGKILPPKYGILKYIYLSYMNKNIKDCTILPISVNYEHIMEIGQIENEWFGRDKANESILSLIKSIPALNLNFGNVQIKMGQPFKLSKFTTNQNSIERTLNRLADHITNSLEWNTVTMNTSLISILFLIKPKYSHHQFYPLLNILRQTIKKLGGILNKDNQDYNIKKLIESESFIKSNEQEEYYELQDKNNLKFIFRMLYYKNNTFYLFCQHAIVCLVIFYKQRQGIVNLQKDDIIEQVLYLQELFQNESFVYQRQKKAEIEKCLQKDVLNIFYKDDIIQLCDQSSEKQFIIEMLLSFIQPIIDNYKQTLLQVCELIENNQYQVKFEDFKSQIFQSLQQKFLQEEIASGESCSINYIFNAIEELVRKNLIEQKKQLNSEKKKFETVLILKQEKLQQINMILNNLQNYSRTLQYETYKK